MKIGIEMSADETGFSHGQQYCRACFKEGSSPSWHTGPKEEFEEKLVRWTLRPNPGYWGDSTPKILVLGFSKGGDQQEMIDLYLKGEKHYEDIPFNSTKGSMRKDLAEVLWTLKVVERDKPIDPLFENGGNGFGFASIVRCSVEMTLPGKEPSSTGNGILSHTIKAPLSFVSRCIERHLLNAPNSVKLVILLSADKKYVRACYSRLTGKTVRKGDKIHYVYSALGKTFVHVPHPSGQAVGFRNVFNGKRPPNKKEKGMITCREQALTAVVDALKDQHFAGVDQNSNSIFGS
jgi:hypothetical protein